MGQRTWRVLIALLSVFTVASLSACTPQEVQQYLAVKSGGGVTAQKTGYKEFSDCKQAVDYLFSGRSDYHRALHVVYRESRYVPTAVSRTGALGCAQLTGGLKRTFLKGPWNDPYWNILALRLAVDDPHWGWCHWDVVNYCRRGGEFGP